MHRWTRQVLGGRHLVEKTTRPIWKQHAEGLAQPPDSMWQTRWPYWQDNLAEIAEEKQMWKQLTEDFAQPQDTTATQWWWPFHCRCLSEMVPWIWNHDHFNHLFSPPQSLVRVEPAHIKMEALCWHRTHLKAYKTTPWKRYQLFLLARSSILSCHWHLASFHSQEVS